MGWGDAFDQKTSDQRAGYRPPKQRPAVDLTVLCRQHIIQGYPASAHFLAFLLHFFR